MTAWKKALSTPWMKPDFEPEDTGTYDPWQVAVSLYRREHLVPVLARWPILLAFWSLKVLIVLLILKGCGVL
jgi:hypothetical protein